MSHFHLTEIMDIDKPKNFVVTEEDHEVMLQLMRTNSYSNGLRSKSDIVEGMNQTNHQPLSHKEDENDQCDEYKSFDNKILHRPYSYSDRKRLLTNRYWNSCRNKRIALGLSILIMILMAGAIVYAAYAITQANAMMDYSESYNIEGTCLCLYSQRICNDCNFVNEYSIIDLPVCDGIKDSQQIFSCNDNTGCSVGEEMSCFTNHECVDVFSSKENDYYEDANMWLSLGAVSLILVGVGILGLCAFVSSDCSVVADCCKFYYGNDEMEYYEECWNERMASAHKLDYFLEYYEREYDMELTDRIGYTILQFYAKEEV